VRKIIVYIATSADGFIARPNGDVEWLNRPRTAGDYGMGDFYRSVDTVVMGRKTYDVGRKLGQSHYRGKKNYVLSRKRAPHRPQDVEFVSCAIPKFATQLRRTDGRDILSRFLLGEHDACGKQNGQSCGELTKDAQVR